MTEIMVLGLPSRDQVRRQLVGVVRPSGLGSIKWIRVAQQLEGLQGGKLYILDHGVDQLSLEQHHELDDMIRARGISKCLVLPAYLAQVLR